MPHVRMPGYGFLKTGAAWEGTRVLDKAGEYEFLCNAPSPTLVIDGKQVVGRTKEQSGKITLAAGGHPFKMTLCGQGLGAGLQYKAPGETQFKDVYEELKEIKAP